MRTERSIHFRHPENLFSHWQMYSRSQKKEHLKKYERRTFPTETFVRRCIQFRMKDSRNLNWRHPSANTSRSHCQATAIQRLYFVLIMEVLKYEAYLTQSCIPITPTAYNSSGQVIKQRNVSPLMGSDVSNRSSQMRKGFKVRPMYEKSICIAAPITRRGTLFVLWKGVDKSSLLHLSRDLLLTMLFVHCLTLSAPVIQ